MRVKYEGSFLYCITANECAKRCALNRRMFKYFREKIRFKRQVILRHITNMKRNKQAIKTEV